MDTKMNKAFWAEVNDCHKYLATGGLGDIQGITQMAVDMGAPKVQNDTALEWAILELAFEGLNARRKLPSQSEGEDSSDD